MNTSRKFAIITLSILALVLLGALSLGFWIVRGKNQEMSELQNLAQLAEEADNLSNLVRSISSTHASELETLEQIILRKDRVVLLIESVEQAANSLGIIAEITSVNEKAEEGNKLSVIEMNIDANGTWSQNLAFLKALESLPYRVMFGRTDIKSAEEGGWTSSITLSVHAFD